MGRVGHRNAAALANSSASIPSPLYVSFFALQQQHIRLGLLPRPITVAIQLDGKAPKLHVGLAVRTCGGVFVDFARGDAAEQYAGCHLESVAMHQGTLHFSLCKGACPCVKRRSAGAAAATTTSKAACAVGGGGSASASKEASQGPENMRTESCSGSDSALQPGSGDASSAVCTADESDSDGSLASGDPGPPGVPGTAAYCG
jgi:hypothetical protein